MRKFLHDLKLYGVQRFCGDGDELSKRVTYGIVTYKRWEFCVKMNNGMARKGTQI
jgi:hypothetical protein